MQKQGHSAGTILTNRSRNITVITPFDNRRSDTAPTLRKGTRWMHRSTLALDEKKWKSDYISSSKSTFGGSKNLSAAEQPLPCSSLHTSHFDIGMGLDGAKQTHYRKQYPKRNTDHPNRIHYPSLVNWSHNVTGSDMQQVLDRKGNKLNYWSSYAEVHNKLGLERGEGVPKAEQPKTQYNVITGVETAPSSSRDLHLISGNRVLHNTRRDAQDNFVLG